MTAGQFGYVTASNISFHLQDIFLNIQISKKFKINQFKKIFIVVFNLSVVKKASKSRLKGGGRGQVCASKTVFVTRIISGDSST